VARSTQLAGLIGPTLIALTISEAMNARIWSANTAPGTYLAGTLWFVAGLSIVRAHNRWVRRWPVVVTLVGWFVLLFGLFRMFAPELAQRGAADASTALAGQIALLLVGIFLTFKAFRPGSRRPLMESGVPDPHPSAVPSIRL